jgi:hypothetical protein
LLFLLDLLKSSLLFGTLVTLSLLRRSFRQLDPLHFLLGPLHLRLELPNLCLPPSPCQPRLLLQLSIVCFDLFVCFPSIRQLKVLQGLPEALVDPIGVCLVLDVIIEPVDLGLQREFHPVELKTNICLTYRGRWGELGRAGT